MGRLSLIKQNDVIFLAWLPNSAGSMLPDGTFHTSPLTGHPAASVTGDPTKSINRKLILQVIAESAPTGHIPSGANALQHASSRLSLQRECRLLPWLKSVIAWSEAQVFICVQTEHCMRCIPYPCLRSRPSESMRPPLAHSIWCWCSPMA